MTRLTQLWIVCLLFVVSPLCWGMDPNFTLLTEKGYQLGERINQHQQVYRVERSGIHSVAKWHAKVNSVSQRVAFDFIRRRVGISDGYLTQTLLVVENRTDFWQIMEGAEMDLMDHLLSQGGPFALSDLRLNFKRLAEITQFLHSIGYCHRDLKPDNFLLFQDSSLKLTDFEFVAESGQSHHLKAGTTQYSAPEVLTGNAYDCRYSDIWSLGITFYVLATSEFLLDYDAVSVLPGDSRENKDNKLASYIADLAHPLKSDLFYGKLEEHLVHTPDLLALIRSMLAIDPKNRIRLEQILAHPFVEDQSRFWDF